MNFIAISVASLVPILLGMIWYSNFMFGKIWMKEAGLSLDQMKTGSMAVIFGCSFLFSFMLAFNIQSLTIHQFAIPSALMLAIEDPTRKESAQAIIDSFTTGIYANDFRTFKHGLLHGIISAIFIVLPVIGMNSLFEKRSFKYIFIHVGYWIISFGIMGGIVSAWK